MSSIPTTDELRQLPLRSIVAFAVRAALRVRSRYVFAKVDAASKRASAAVDRAIEVARRFAADDAFDSGEAAEAEQAVIEAVMLAGDPERGNKPSALAANAAYAAANAAVAAHDATESSNPTSVANKVVNAARTAAEAAQAANSHARHGLVRDFQTLVSRARASFPEVGRAVDLGGSGQFSNATAEVPEVEPKKEAAPNEADLLQILKLRDQIAADRNELINQRREMEERIAEFDSHWDDVNAAKAELEKEREELEKDADRLASDRERVRLFVAELSLLLARHGFGQEMAERTNESDGDSPAEGTTTTTEEGEPGPETDDGEATPLPESELETDESDDLEVFEEAVELAAEQV